MMKKLLLLICLGFITAAAQSIFILDSGTSLEIGTNTDFCADSIGGNGVLIGNGTFCGNPTSIESENVSTLPTDFALGQNYPNPFNPSTKISWQSPVSSHTTLKLYDVLGNEVATVVNEYKPAGTYEVEFDATNLISGIYFYRMEVKEFIQTKKLILLK
jgi:hypothetical protein